MMESISTPTYSSMLSGKGALLDETLALLQQINHGHSPGEVRALVMDHDLLGKMTTSTRQSVWDHIHARYLTDGDHTRRVKQR